MQENKEYTAHPTVTIFGYTMEATPTLKFKVNETVSATTGAAGNITMTGATISGSATGASTAKNTVSIGIVYNTSGSPSMNNGIKVASGNTANGDFSVTLSGLTENTTYYYCSYIAIDGTYYYGSVLSFTTKKKSDDLTPGDAIDLGLSVKWADHNVGANSPEEHGGYYAWGETEEKSEYTQDTYKWCEFRKKKWFINDSYTYTNIGSEISGTKYDVAHVKWGGNWRMPSQKEMKELIDNCKHEQVTYKGVTGYKFTSKKNGNSIFLPAAGYRIGTKVGNSGTSGDYWSGTLLPVNSSSACYLSCYGCRASWYNYNNRNYGFSVRPVSD